MKWNEEQSGEECQGRRGVEWNEEQSGVERRKEQREERSGMKWNDSGVEGRGE